MSSLREFAKRELNLLGMSEDSADEMDAKMYNCVMDIIRIFSAQGHSGFSASYCTSLVTKLMEYEALSPLTGNDDEWMDVSDFGNGTALLQNKRAFNVFKEIKTDGTITEYQNDRYIFKDQTGCCFTSFDSRYSITEWPYTPDYEYVDVFREQECEDKGESCNDFSLCELIGENNVTN